MKAHVAQMSFPFANRNAHFAEMGLPVADLPFQVGDFKLDMTDMKAHFGDFIPQETDFMPQFPVKRAELLTVARNIENAMTQHPDAFEKCLVTLAQVQSADAAQGDTSNARLDAQATLDAAVIDDQSAINLLSDRAKTVLEYGKSAKRQFPDILKWLGWEDAAPAALLVPGAVRGFEVKSQTPGAVTFDYKAPIVGRDALKGEGGAAAFYKILWRQNVGDDWQDAASDVDLDISVNLNRWTRGQIVEFAVVAINKAGQGPVSAGISITV